MKRDAWTFSIGTLLLGAALLGCGSARRSEPLAGALAPDGDAKHGEAVFMKHCHGCHPGGEGGLGPALNNKPLPGWAMKTQIRMGVGAMPAFSDAEIDSAELEALILYLEELRHHGPA